MRIFGASRRTKIALGAASMLGLGWGSFEGVTRSDWFADRVRASVVAQLEQASGGAVSIEQLLLGEKRLSFDVVGLEIRSAEGDDGTPFLTVPHASAQLGWGVLLGGATTLESVRVVDPVLHLTVAEDGTSNFPKGRSSGSWSGFAVHRFELSGGLLIWNGQPRQLEFRGSGLDIRTEFDAISEEYAIQLEIDDPQLGTDQSAALAGMTASVSAVFGRSGFVIHSAELRGENLSVQAQGTISGAESPRVECNYSISTALGPLAAAFGSGAMELSGSLEIGGDLRWEFGSGTTRYAGTVTAFGVSSAAMDLQLSAVAEYAGSDTNLEVTGVSGQVLGGSLEGAVSVSGEWPKLLVVVRGKASDIALRTLATAVRTSAPPWSGLVDAEFESAGSRSGGFETNLAVSIRPTDRPSTLPLEGEASLVHRSHDGSVTVPGFSLETPNLRASGSGFLSGDSGGELLVDVSMDSRQAVERILATLQAETVLPPAAPDGAFSFRGSVRWPQSSAAAATIKGDFAVDDFIFGGQQWEHLAIHGELAPDGLQVLRGQLVDGPGRLSLTGALPLREDGALSLQVTASGMNAAKLARASGFTLPINGTLAMEATMSGSLAAPEASTTVAVETPTFFGEPFDRLDAEVLYDPAGFELRNASLERGESRLLVSASMATDTRQVRLELESNRWPLDEFAWARALAPNLAGTLRFDLRAGGVLPVSGSLRSLELDGTWDISDLRKDGLDFGQWTGRVRSESNAPTVEVDWNADIFDGTFEGSASLWEVGSSSYNGSLEYVDLSVRRLAEFFDLPVGSTEGTVTGTAGFGGVVGSASTFEVNGTIDRAEVRLATNGEDPFVISNVFPLRWGIRDGNLRFDSMNLTGPETEFVIDGTVALTGERALDLGLEGAVNLVLLRGLAGALEPSGATKINLRILGSLDAPSPQGSLEVIDASIGSPSSPFPIHDLNGTIAFQGGQAKIERLTATSGGGTVSFSGVTAYRASGLEYRLHATADDVRVNYPPSVNSVIDGQFTLAGAGTRSILNGDVLISRMATADNLSFADLFSSLHQPESRLGSNPLLDGMQVNVHIGAIQQLPIETTLVRNVEADFDLEVVGTIAAPSLLGEIQIAQGELRMLGTHYRVNRGDIRFLNPLQAEPVLNVELETRIRDVDLALVLSGPGRSLALSYRSDPPLPFHDLVDLVAVGKEPTVDPSISSRRRIEQQSLVQTGADNILSQAISRPVSKRLQRFFGVSRLKVDPQIGGLESNPSARLSTEQQIADDITLIYSYDLSSAQQQAIRIEWNPDRKWSFIVTRDQNGLLGSDVLYKVRMR